MLGSPAGPSGYATLTVCWMHCIYAYSLILVLMNRRSFALVPVGGRAPRMGRHVQSVMNRWHGIFNGAVRSARCLRSVMICAERNPSYDAFGAPLPPVEISINATRVEVAANVEDGHSEAWSVVQQLRGSAPYGTLGLHARWRLDSLAASCSSLIHRPVSDFLVCVPSLL